MSLENGTDVTPETKLVPRSTLDAAKDIVLGNARKAFFIAGLAVGSTASATETPKPTQEQIEARDNKVQLQKQQLDREISQNAGILGALRDDHTLDSALGATGLNPTQKLDTTISPYGTAMPKPLTEAEIAANRSSKVQLQKQQLDREISQNAGVLGALRDDHTLDSPLGATGLNADMMNGIGGLIGSKGSSFESTPTVSKEALLKQQQQLQLEKEALERKIAENAKLLKAMSAESTPEKK